MIYPGEVKQFVLALTDVVSAAPTISIVDPASGAFAVRDAAMDQVMDATNATAIAGLYHYGWNTAGKGAGAWVALVTYGLGGAAHNNELLEVFQLGDSRILGTVALDATVAKDATAAKDATVAKAADLRQISPDDIAAIKAKVLTLPANPADQQSLLTVLAKLGDVLDASVGAWKIDKTANPKTLTLYRTNGNILAVYTYSDDSNAQLRAISQLNLS